LFTLSTEQPPPTRERMSTDANRLTRSSGVLATPARQTPRPTATATLDASPSRVDDLKELLKPGISMFVVVTAAAGYLFGATGGIDLGRLVALLFGTALTAGGSGALNHWWERELDALMKRTRERPLPAGRMAPGFVLGYGLAAIVAGLGLLWLFVNPLTTALALGTSLCYLLVYTPLKRKTKYNTLVGAVPGALPALGGYVAATGTLGAAGWAIFAILFLWQLPHFLSLAWMYRDDYARGGFKMLPVVEPDGRSTAFQALAATLALLVAGVVPAAIGAAGWLYLIGMGALGTWFTLPAFAFFYEPTAHRARRLLLASIVYVPTFFALVVLDYFLL
jgi:protoheme IX farnesyltransferase